MDAPKKIVIAGAGLVGSLLAIALKQRGHEVLVLEKRADLRLEAMSAGKSINLILTAKGIRTIVSLGLWEKVQTILSPVIGRMMHSKTGEQAFQPYGKNETECNFSVGRSDLNKLLLNEAELSGIKIFFESSVAKIDFENKKVTLENNDVLNYDLIFGADGSGSIVRKELIAKVGTKANYKVEALGTDYKELLMPAQKNGDYPMDKKSLHIWPRGNHMLMALPNLDGSFTMTLYMPVAWFKDFEDQAKFKKYFEENYADVIPLMPDYLTDYYSRSHGFLGIVRMKPWIYQDQLALLGDAAHAIVPFFGQGMNSGFLDVYTLLSLMDQYPNNYSKIFSEYELVQKKNGDAIADLSLDNFVEMCERVGDENFLFKKKVEMKIEQTFPEKYRSRYGMVTYTLIPYYLALEAGFIQEEILSELTKDKRSLDEINLLQAEQLINEKLVPWFIKNNINVERYLPE
jgi:kynurenine 3-monooxygenase